ncbi:MAG: outer membrane beta-barrel protein, partial [Catalinimonas sp.]
MKKVFLLLFGLFLTSQFATAQSTVKIGLRVAPGISINRIEDAASSGRNIENDGAGLRFTAGPVFDFFFADQYAFSTGLWYTTRRVGLSNVPVVTRPGDPVPPGGVANGTYNLQYIQLPVS